MNGWLHQLGTGAALAWVALPLLAWAVGRGSPQEPASRQRALYIALVLGASLVFLPALRHALPARATSFSAGAPLAQAMPAVMAATRSVAVSWPWLGAVWLALCLVEASLALRGAWQLRRLMHRATSADPVVLQKIDQLARAMGLRPPHVKVCAQVAVPFVTGVVRPVLVLPGELVSRVDGHALELLMRHELTHLKRGDHWRAALVAAVRVPLAFHPTARWLCRELAEAREEAVDASVAQPHAHAYASLLVETAALAQTSRFVPVVGISSSSLERRIAMLTQPVVRRPARLWPTLIAFAMVAWIPWVVPAAAGEPASTPQSGEVIQLNVGATMTVMFPGMKRVAIADPAVADVSIADKAHLNITGKGKGTTKLMVWTTSDDERLSYVVEVQ